MQSGTFSDRENLSISQSRLLSCSETQAVMAPPGHHHSMSPCQSVANFEECTAESQYLHPSTQSSANTRQQHSQSRISNSRHCRIPVFYMRSRLAHRYASEWLSTKHCFNQARCRFLAEAAKRIPGSNNSYITRRVSQADLRNRHVQLISRYSVE